MEPLCRDCQKQLTLENVSPNANNLCMECAADMVIIFEPSVIEAETSPPLKQLPEFNEDLVTWA